MPSLTRPDRVVVHVAEIELSEATGMGRVAWHWRRAFLDRGYEFVHIGPAQLSGSSPRSLFPILALRHFRRLGLARPILLVHEPAGGFFATCERPAIVFSHGLEARGEKFAGAERARPALRTRLRRLCTGPLWKLRAWSAEAGLRRAAALLVINRDDAAYVHARHRRPWSRMMVFRNGVHPAPATAMSDEAILFLGTWLPRKGIDVLGAAAGLLHARGRRPRWVLGGLGVAPEVVWRAWPRELRDATELVPHFAASEEAGLLARCGLFVLPSYFEGQPLSLLQAMAAGRCCLASACCGQRDLIRDRHNGLLHAPGDAAGLAARIEECLRDPALRTRLGAAARESVHDRTWPRVSSEVVSFVEAMAGR